MMIRDENKYIGPCLLSTAPYVDEIIITDTGSTDGTIEIVEFIIANFLQDVNVRFEKINVDAHVDMSYEKDDSDSLKGGLELGDIRRRHIKETKTKFVWIVDGDEVYPDHAIQNIKMATDMLVSNEGLNCCYIPFLWTNNGGREIVEQTDGCDLYTLTGRIFRADKLWCVGKWGNEMHTYAGRILYSHSRGVIKSQCKKPLMFHYSLEQKPNRRTITRSIPNPYAKPEAISRWEAICGQIRKNARRHR